MSFVKKDNKSNESEWDFDILPDELADLNLDDFDFDFGIDEEEEDFDENDLERDDEKRWRCFNPNHIPQSARI